MILRKGGRRVAKQGEVFQRCCRWFELLFIRDFKRDNFDHVLRYHDISLRKQKDSGSGLAFVPSSQVIYIYT